MLKFILQREMNMGKSKQNMVDENLVTRIIIKTNTES